MIWCMIYFAMLKISSNNRKLLLPLVTSVIECKHTIKFTHKNNSDIRNLQRNVFLRCLLHLVPVGNKCKIWHYLCNQLQKLNIVYIHNCVSLSSSFPHFPDSKEQMEMELFMSWIDLQKFEGVIFGITQKLLYITALYNFCEVAL